MAKQAETEKKINGEMKRQTATIKNLIKGFALMIIFAFCSIQFIFAAPISELNQNTSQPRYYLIDTPEEEAFTFEEDDAPASSENLVGFYGVMNKVLIKRGWKKENLCSAGDALISRIVREYGSIFVVDEKVAAPPVCMFTNDEEVQAFQTKAGFVSAEIAGARIELQSAAMEALLAARTEAQALGLDITPRDGAEAGRRNYADTLRLWKSRFEPACDYWQKQGRLSEEQIAKLKSLPIKDQVSAVLILEKQGIYFNKFFNNSILYSVAAPGTSQHLSMLALDINEYRNAEVRRILENHGWFQTVRNDVPHFTFLGHKKDDLKKFGLREIETSTGKYWVPNV